MGKQGNQMLVITSRNFFLPLMLPVFQLVPQSPISPVSKTRWILQAKLSRLLNPAVPRQLF